MKIHVLLLPDPEEFFFSIYIKFVNEKFCVVKNKLASFLMIIIQIIILYFIQIRHTDDFPSMGIPASI